MILIDKHFLQKNGVPPVDYHIHTCYSDGKGAIEEFVKEAVKKNMQEIAITDHVWKTSKWIPKYVKEIKSIRAKYDFPVLVGIEAKAINLSGDIDAPDEAIQNAQIVMGTCHRYPSEEDYEFYDHGKLTIEEAASIEAETIINMIKRREIDVIAHPTRSFYKFYPKHKGNFPLRYLDEIAKTATKYGVALEWNEKWGKDFILECYLKNNVSIVLGSDAHLPSEVGNIDNKRILKTSRRLGQFPSVF